MARTVRLLKRLFWPVVVAGLVLAATGVVEPAYVFAPLLGLAIWRVGIASFGSLRRGGGHVPDGRPEPMDLASERIRYWCGGCGAELVLIVRGSDVAPRHCGEAMTERREIRSASR